MRLSLVTYVLLNTLLHFHKLFSTVCRCWEEANEKQNREKKRHKKPTTALSIPSSSFMLCSAHWEEVTGFLASIVIDTELWPPGTGEVIHHVHDPTIVKLIARGSCSLIHEHLC